MFHVDMIHDLNNTADMVLGLVPENGSAINFSQSMGVHRANEFLMFGRKMDVEELKQWGIVNQVFPAEGFQSHVTKYLEDQLAVNDGKSMMETKRLQNEPLRSGRLLAVVNSMDALAERVRDPRPWLYLLIRLLSVCGRCSNPEIHRKEEVARLYVSRGPREFETNDVSTAKSKSRSSKM
jgi:hypothetical protein